MIPVLIPQPRDLRAGGAWHPVGRLDVRGVPAPLGRYQARIARLAGEVGDGHGPSLPVTITEAATPPEGYSLRVDADSVHVGAADSLGALHAVRTLVGLWRAGEGLPAIEIADHPTYRTRGLFVESAAGTDLMTLSDWRALIDKLGQWKINLLGVSVYGCWQLGHDRQRTEFMFVPLQGYPGLRTPQRIVTWDAELGRETTVEYLPKMFEHDFFGDVVAYAREQGIEVVPHLGGPGHSTLIPREVPELSALDENGQLTGYGYCVGREAALDALRALVRELVEQHLVPNGVRRLHVAGDEYYPIRNIDPDDLNREVSPYCRCPACRELTPGQLLRRYLGTVGGVLAEHGIGMVHWQDTLVREGALDDYLDDVRRAGLPVPAIAWWKYNDPVPTPDPSRAPAWVSPTTGIFSQLFHQDFSLNIETVLRRGHAAGATGVLAYSLPHPADDANMACLADLAWNLEGSAGASGFWQRWAASTCPGDPDGASHAWSVWRGIASCYPLMVYVLDHVLPMFATTAGGVTRYPDDLLRVFSAPQPGLAQVLGQTRDTVREAVRLMPDRPDPGPDPVRDWAVQCGRLADTLDLFLDVLDAARTPDHDTDELARRGRELLVRTSAATPAYLRPAVLREQWGFVSQIGPVLERLRGDVAPAQSWFAWIV